jgi:hypothetical protein
MRCAAASGIALRTTLVGIMNGRAPATGNAEDWRFVAEAVRLHLAAS